MGRGPALSPSAGTYDDVGAGHAVVFSHGMLMDRRMFASQVAAVQGSHRAIAFDHRSRAVRDGGSFDLYDLADDCLALLDRLEIERCVLVGMSMGGFMGLRFALRFPDRIAGLVLIGASAVPYGADDRDHWGDHFAQHRDATSLPVGFARGEAEAHFSAFTRQEHPELVETWAERFAARTGIDTWHETLSWLHQDDIRPDLSSVGCPVLLVHGDEDDAVPRSSVRATHSALGDARQLFVPLAGHAVNIEAPDAVNEALLRFMRAMAWP